MLLVVPGAGDIDAAVQSLVGLGVGAFDARQLLLRGVPFVLPFDPAAGGTAGLTAAGVELFVVDEETWVQAPELVQARSFVLSSEGLRVTTRAVAGDPARELLVAWTSVELLLRARSV